MRELTSYDFNMQRIIDKKKKNIIRHLIIFLIATVITVFFIKEPFISSKLLSWCITVSMAVACVFLIYMCQDIYIVYSLQDDAYNAYEVEVCGRSNMGTYCNIFYIENDSSRVARLDSHWKDTYKTGLLIRLKAKSYMYSPEYIINKDDSYSI